MADEPLGQRKETASPWKKIFTAFKLAIDIKKLLLAAAGIVATALGWWVLAVVFYSMQKMPQWKDVETADKEAAFSLLKEHRRHWNLLHELAGPTAATKESAVRVDAADVAKDYTEYKILDEWERAYGRHRSKVEITKEGTLLKVPEEGKSYSVTLMDPKDLPKVKDKTFPLDVVKIEPGKDAKDVLAIDGTLFTVDKNGDELKKYLESGESLADIKKRSQKVAGGTDLFTRFENELKDPRIKPTGKLRTWPWFEERGQNPYLLVTGNLKQTGEGKRLLGWIADQIPVLIEPVVKFLAPVVYLFDADAGFYARVYLILVLLWTLAVWGFFGGAICRMAAVQFARNEKITLQEAVSFARERAVSYFTAPVFPLAFVAFIVVCLVLFGFLELIPIVGDILIAGLLWPLVLVAGCVMAVVLVGLVGWPLMNATISTEASDSFDALSRSYSYVYQAPWQYLWYWFLATLYGAVLVFFVGFMASLMVFLGKWGVSQTPFLEGKTAAYDRNPAYLFDNAPTSFGWRDLLISGSKYADSKSPVVTPSGAVVYRPEFSEEYQRATSWYNKLGATLVSLWIYLFFLLVVGFGYSYFWSVSTIIYFLMRHHVDETGFDEVQIEEEAGPSPFAPKPTAPSGPAPSAPEPKPGTLSLPTVEAPALRVTPLSPAPQPAPLPPTPLLHVPPLEPSPSLHVPPLESPTLPLASPTLPMAAPEPPTTSTPTPMEPKAQDDERPPTP
jgi:hypothetical protein